MKGRFQSGRSWLSLAFFLGLTAVLAMGLLMATLQPDQNPPGAQAKQATDTPDPAATVTPTPNKVTICHGTNSVSNPYEQITVDGNSVDFEGHLSHTGPVASSEAVAQALKDAKIQWGDIIPNALNWDAEGQAVWNNGCAYPPTDTPVPPTDTPTATETPVTPTDTPTATETPLTGGTTDTPTPTATETEFVPGVPIIPIPNIPPGAPGPFVLPTTVPRAGVLPVIVPPPTSTPLSQVLPAIVAPRALPSSGDSGGGHSPLWKVGMGLLALIVGLAVLLSGWRIMAGRRKGEF